MSDDDRAARAEARRATMTVRKTTVDDDSDDDVVRGEAAMALVARLSLAAWSLAEERSLAKDRRGAPAARQVVVRFVPRTVS
jgi:hypothetical protein